MRLDHPIFQGPRRVELELVPATISPNHAVYPPSLDTRDPRAWRVEVVPKDARAKPPYGLVCDGYGFEDSPDCEWISSGDNTKGPMALAIGRMANRFFWGFQAPPSRLTPSARAALVNAIAYMDQFDGVGPLVVVEKGRGLLGGRDHALLSAHYLGVLAKNGGSSAEIRDDFPERVRMATGLDPARTLDWYRRNLEFLVPASAGYDVDDVCLQLGIGNRDPRFVPEIVRRLALDPRDAVARTLLSRYVPAARDVPADALAAWYDASRPFLYFTDRGGFEWRVDEPAQRAGVPRERRGRAYALD